MGTNDERGQRGGEARMSDLAKRAGLTSKPKVAKPNVSSDESAHHPQIEVGPEDIRRHAPPGAEKDPTYVPEVYLNPNRYYRWVNKRKIDYRLFQGYELVRYDDCPVHRKTAEGWVQLGDCVFMCMPRDLWEKKVRDQEEYWAALYMKHLEKAYNELDKAGGAPFVVEPDGKEVS
jgi:hypothetical protein